MGIRVRSSDSLQDCCPVERDEDGTRINNGCDHWEDCLKRHLTYPLDEDEKAIVSNWDEDIPWVLCPRKRLVEYLERYVQEFNFLADENLCFHLFPRTGGLNVQDNKTMQAFTIIKNVHIEKRHDDLKKK